MCAKEGNQYHQRGYSPARSPTLPEHKLNTAMGLYDILHKNMTNGLILLLQQIHTFI